VSSRRDAGGKDPQTLGDRGFMNSLRKPFKAVNGGPRGLTTIPNSGQKKNISVQGSGLGLGSIKGNAFKGIWGVEKAYFSGGARGCSSGGVRVGNKSRISRLPATTTKLLSEKTGRRSGGVPGDENF